MAIFVIGINLAVAPPWANYVGDFLLAVAVGIAFRYAASTHRGGRRMQAALVIVVKADLLTVSTFELALFAWLSFIDYAIFSDPPFRPNSPVFWFFAQTGFISGFLAAWPVTRWLIHRGVKAASPTAA